MSLTADDDQNNTQALQQYQNYDLLDEIIQKNDDQYVKLQTDLAIKFFIESPFGQIYKEDLVQATSDIPLSKIYDNLISHASEFQFNGQRVVVRILPVCKSQFDLFHRIEVYNVTKMGYTADIDNYPMAVFIFISDQALLLKCPNQKNFVSIIQKNSLHQLNQGIYEYSKCMRKLEREENW